MKKTKVTATIIVICRNLVMLIITTACQRIIQKFKLINKKVFFFILKIDSNLSNNYDPHSGTIKKDGEQNAYDTMKKMEDANSNRYDPNSGLIQSTGKNAQQQPPKKTHKGNAYNPNMLSIDGNNPIRSSFNQNINCTINSSIKNTFVPIQDNYNNLNTNSVSEMNKPGFASFIPNHYSVSINNLPMKKIDEENNPMHDSNINYSKKSSDDDYDINDDNTRKLDDDALQALKLQNDNKILDPNIKYEKSELFQSEVFGAIVTKFKDRKDDDKVPLLPINEIVDSEEDLDYVQNNDNNGGFLQSSEINMGDTVIKSNKDTNNWCIQSFLPTPGQQFNARDLMKSISFIGSSHKFAGVIRQLQADNKQYTDPDFPPAFSSQWGFGECTTYSKTSWQEYQWKRPIGFFEGPYKIYEDNVNPNDIMQGQLGDCYFQSAIAAIAEWKDRVKKLFLTRECNEQGVFCVGLCINGMWEEVILDDFFPVSHRKHCTPEFTPSFNHSRGNELWVMVLEKAWAKVHGGYLNINSGLTREALHDLTGAPCTTYFNDESTDEERWEIILDADKRHYIMAAGTKDLIGNGKDDIEEKSGIVGSHAYSMLEAVEIVRDGADWRKVGHDEDSKKLKGVTKLVKLRNPWGKGEWKGAFSDTDSKMSVQLRTLLNHTNEVDGCFYMPFDEFISYFSDFQVCYYMDNFQYSSSRYETEKNQHCYFTFFILEEGEYYFTLNQQNKRFFPKSKNYKYSSCMFTLGRFENDGRINYLGAIQKADKESWFKAYCTKGKYYCSVYTPWQSFVNQITIAAYGAASLDLKPVTQDAMPVNYYQKLVENKAQKSQAVWKDFGGQGHADIRYKFEHGNDGFGYFYFENKSPDTELKCELDFTETKNLKAQPPYTLNKPCIIVPSQSKEFLIYFMTDAPSKIAFRMMASFKKNVSSLKNEIKTKGQKFIRKLNGNDVGICLYGLMHHSGCFWEYENLSIDYMQEETITVKLVNAWIDGYDGDTIKIVLHPGQKKLIEVKYGEGGDPGAVGSGNLDKCTFRVTKVD